MTPSGQLASPFGRLRRRLVGMSGRDVTTVVAAVSAAGSVCVVAGGWGIDALAGRRTRRHADLDLVVDDRSDLPAATAATVLESMGFGLVRCDVVDGARFGHRQLYEDRAGRLVDLHPGYAGPAFSRADSRRRRTGAAVFGAGSVVVGTVDGRPVACLSVGEQIASHRGYLLRDADHRDLEVLAALGARTFRAFEPPVGTSAVPLPEREGGDDVPPSCALA